MKKIIYGLVILIVFLVLCVFVSIYNPFLTNNIQKISLRTDISGKASSCFLSDGSMCSPTSVRFAYPDIDHIPAKLIDKETLARICKKQLPPSVEVYSRNVYVEIEKKNGEAWHSVKSVTDNLSEVDKNNTYLIGSTGHGIEYDQNNNCLSVSVSYNQIENFKTVSSFVDFYSVYFLNTDFNSQDAHLSQPVANVYVDKNGHAKAQSISIANNICVSKWKLVDFSNVNCWRDYRLSESSKSLKRYNFTFIPLLIDFIFR